MNKNVKIVFSVLLCVVMMLSIFTFSGYAETETSSPEIFIDCNLDEIKVGDEFEVYVSLKNVSDVKNVKLFAFYNSDDFELVMVTNPFPFKYVLGPQDKYSFGFYYSFSFKEPFDGDVDVMKIVFIAKRECVSELEIGVETWNDNIWSDGFDYSIVPANKKFELSVEKEPTTFNCTFSEKDVEIGEIVSVYLSVENCIDLIKLKAHVYFDMEYFEFYDLRQEVFKHNLYYGDGKCTTEMSVYIMDEHIFGDKELLVFSLRAIKSGVSTISVEVVDWSGENKPENTEFPITVSDEVYVDKFAYDVNLDGKITAMDARLTLRAAALIEPLIGKSHEAADTDKDYLITAADARKILRKSAGLE